MNVEMNEGVRVKWVEALESGKYKQTTSVLAKVDGNGEVVGHCCLGVLCEIAVAEGVIPAPLINPQISLSVLYGRNHDNDVSLPPEVMEWAGVSREEVELTTPIDGTRVLTGVNDAGYTFAKIAQIIKS